MDLPRRFRLAGQARFLETEGEQKICYVHGCGRASKRASLPERSDKMLMFIFILLLALWLLGMISSYTLGGYIHILLVIAVVVFLIRIIQGRRAV